MNEEPKMTQEQYDAMMREFRLLLEKNRRFFKKYEERRDLNIQKLSNEEE